MRTLETLIEEVQNCTKCDLWKGRNKSVFGDGPKDAKIMLIGLGPGYHENLQGKPFVGPAGKLLDKLLSIAGLNRERIYITNIIKSYLPNNRATDKQITACTPYLDFQIDIINPRTIIPLGNVATKYVFKRFGLSLFPMNKLHAKMFPVSTLFMQVKIVPMYHPSAVLRNPRLRITVENDWNNIKKILGNLNC